MNAFLEIHSLVLSILLVVIGSLLPVPLPVGSNPRSLLEVWLPASGCTWQAKSTILFRGVGKALLDMGVPLAN